MLSEQDIKTIQKNIKEDDTKWPIIFDALSDFTRFRMFKLLMQNNDLCVTDIAGIFNISLPAVSQQLKILEINGLVRKERMGQMICYEANKKDKIAKIIIKLIKH